MVVRRDGSVHFPDPPASAPPLSLGGHSGDGPQPYGVEHTPGEQVLLYTDGITEARDGDGSFCPLGERAGLLKAVGARNALDLLSEDVAGHVCGPQHDGMALLPLRCHAHADVTENP